jgi:hypothetical protein
MAERPKRLTSEHDGVSEETLNFLEDHDSPKGR